MTAAVCMTARSKCTNNGPGNQTSALFSEPDNDIIFIQHFDSLQNKDTVVRSSVSDRGA